MEIELDGFIAQSGLASEVEMHCMRLDGSANLWLFGHGVRAWKKGKSDADPGPISLKLAGFVSRHLPVGIIKNKPVMMKIEATANQDWAQSSCAQIYCNSPITHPTSVILAVERALEKAELHPMLLDCFGVDHGETINNLNKRLKRDSFLLSDVPIKLVHDAIVTELKKQQVDFTVLRKDAKDVPPFRVALGRNSFFCEKISAVEFDHRDLQPLGQEPVGYSHSAA